MSYADLRPSSNNAIYREIARLQQTGRCAALAIPVRLSGSVPFANQSRLLIRDDGSILGTVGGGLLEAGVLEQTPRVITTDEPSILEFDLDQDEASNVGMICGGKCVVLIEPVRPGRAVEIYTAAAQCEADGSHVVLISAIRDDGSFHKLALLPDGVLLGSTGEADTDQALRALAKRHGMGEEPYFAKTPFRVFIQPVSAPPSLYIFGAGHVAIPVAYLAGLVGFRTTVVDDRDEFANQQRFPQADQVLVAKIDEAFQKLSIGAGSYIVAITRGHVLDEEVVALGLPTAARYIGMIGSRRKAAAIRSRLRKRGFSEADVARIHAPIGVEIGAETVGEIAVSIVAELVGVRRQACV